MSKFRFLGCIFGGAVLCIYYANEFSFLPLFVLFRSFLALLFVLICFVISFLIPLLCPILSDGLNTDTLVNVPRYHVATLPRYQVAILFAVAV